MPPKKPFTPSTSSVSINRYSLKLPSTACETTEVSLFFPHIIPHKPITNGYRRPCTPWPRTVESSTTPPEKVVLANDWQKQGNQSGPHLSSELDPLLQGIIAPPTSPEPNSKLIKKAGEYIKVNLRAHFFSNNGTFYDSKTKKQIYVKDIKVKSINIALKKKDLAERVIYNGVFQDGNFSGTWIKYDDINDFTVTFKVENDIVTEIESTTQEVRLDISPEDQKRFVNF